MPWWCSLFLSLDVVGTFFGLSSVWFSVEEHVVEGCEGRKEGRLNGSPWLMSYVHGGLYTCGSEGCSVFGSRVFKLLGHGLWAPFYGFWVLQTGWVMLMGPRVFLVSVWA